MEDFRDEPEKQKRPEREDGRQFFPTCSTIVATG